MKEYETCEENILKAAIKTKFPTPTSTKMQFENKEEKISFIAEKFSEIMVALGLDLENESLQRTPYRVAKMYVNEVFSGLDDSNFPEIRFVENEYQHSIHGNMVFVKINLNSFCEHHFVPIMGTAYIAYIPNEKLIGLSKIPRILNFFSKRPQLQERLGAQIADSLSTLLDTPHVAISITAQHFCMVARGIEDFTSHTTTNVLKGNFETDHDTKRQFFEAINRKS